MYDTIHKKKNKNKQLTTKITVFSLLMSCVTILDVNYALFFGCLLPTISKIRVYK